MTGETRLPGEPDPAERRYALMIVGAVLVAMFLGLLIEGPGRHDRVTGSQGPFPRPLGSAAPAAPTQVVHRNRRPVAIVHGLAVETTDFALVALNARTGKEYWRYEPFGDPDVVSVEVSADSVAAWFDDGKLVAIDLRTGTVRWRAHLTGRGFRGLDIGAGRIFVETSGAVTAFSERDGDVLWRMKEHSRSCEDPTPWDVHDMAEHLTVVNMNCDASEEQSGILIGVDSRSGAELWRRAVRDHVDRADGHTLVAVAPRDTGRAGGAPLIQLLDVDRNGAEPRAEFTSDDWFPSDAQGSVVIGEGDDEPPGTFHSTLVTAYDTQTGERAWERRAAEGFSFGSAAIADGRVYVVENSTVLDEYEDQDRDLQADLLVLDAHTGKLLHRLRLPDLTVPDGVRPTDLMVQGVGDGAVRLGWAVSRDDEWIVT
ncbi:PQQ-binding-like beta-propeller repeat protein [Streptomyces sp. NPDC051920]|uniref:outer membrane protein assembly factor BamB family protein n=1 Tax=Streptomyces sp. NPDC051920 TaxID=3155523 RepID=UPI003412B9FF